MGTHPRTLCYVPFFSPRETFINVLGELFVSGSFSAAGGKLLISELVVFAPSVLGGLGRITH